MESPLSLLAAFSFGAVCSAIAICCLLQLSAWLPRLQRAADLHHPAAPSPPRLGGVALVFAFVLLAMAVQRWAVGETSPHPFTTLVAGTLGMFLVGLLDDLRPIPAAMKLAAQVGVALGIWAGGIGLGIPSTPLQPDPLLSVLWIVGITNAFNLIDGLDGLAAGIGLCLLALLAAIGLAGGVLPHLVVGLAGALLALLAFNFPPARIYLGDGGAYFLGCSIALLTLIHAQNGQLPGLLLLPLFLLVLPLLDTACSVLRRLVQGLPVLHPDRGHLHHRLLEAGFSPCQAVLSLYALTLVCFGLGLTFVSAEARWVRGATAVAASLLLFALCRLILPLRRVGYLSLHPRAPRAEILYTRALTRVLEMEAGRAGSLDDLWNHLVSLAMKLGFSRVALQLPAELRIWGPQEPAPQTSSCCYHLSGPLPARLTLHGPTPESGKNEHRPAIHDRFVFEIIAVLVAEGWQRATRRWARHHRRRGPAPNPDGTPSTSLRSPVWP